LKLKFTEYIDFYISLYSLCNGSCQVFLILFLFIETRFDKINFIKNSRKIIYFILFIIATLITPPDVTSQIIIGCSFILMYEFIIVFLFLKLLLFQLGNQLKLINIPTVKTKYPIDKGKKDFNPIYIN